MSNPFRTASGGRIDRGRPISFTFDGEHLNGYAGDTLASALLANGRHLVGRSFKYHRPRGILTASSSEPNALVTVIRDAGRVTPNVRATEIELYEGLETESQNCWPSLQRDLGALSDHLGPLFAAGFYYKTFMGPRLLGRTAAWKHLFEPLIRRAAGLGRAPGEPDPDRYAQRFAHCDVLIVGAGPAGLAAALAASDAGARVLLADDQAEMGGTLLAEPRKTIGGKPAQTWLADVLEQLANSPHVRLLPRTTAFGYYAQNMLGLAQRLTDHLPTSECAGPRERLWQVRANEVVLATGAIEQPLTFPDNDRPGIMLAGAALTYLERYGVKLGRRALLVGRDDVIYRTALALDCYGVDVAAVLDQRPQAGQDVAEEVSRAGIPIRFRTTVAGTRGRLRVREVQTAIIGEDEGLSDGGMIACDHVLMSAGWTPAVHLFSQSRGLLRFDEATGTYLPGKAAQHLRTAGACCGIDNLEAAIESGRFVGAEAARAAGYAVALTHATSSADEMAVRSTKSARKRVPEAPGRCFVDFQNDVTTRDLRLAIQEGFRSIEHVKRYTTLGMATDQGKTSSTAALGVVSDALRTPIAGVGLTTFRPPYTPVTFGTLAGTARGELFDPVRRTPIDGWAQTRGAAFEDVGFWKRAHYFPRDGEGMGAAVARECRTVRGTVGMFDASTLGKIEVAGPDAAEFLERMYVAPVRSLGIGRCRYSVLLNEAGYILDDGIIARVAADRFHVTTTTGGATAVLHLMEDYRQTEWPELEAWLTSTTEQWAAIAVQGPRAREALAPFVAAASPALPHMAVCETRVCGVPARLFRVSFTGELGFEVNVPADHATEVWEQLIARVEVCGGCAYGTETMHVLRAEKGYIIVGQETDGTVTPDDVGLSWMIGRTKQDFVGKRSLARSDMLRPDRKQLVGLLSCDQTSLLEEGSQLTRVAQPRAGTHAEGHVTSSYHSQSVGRPIALALLEGGRARIGERLFVPMPHGSIEVEVTLPLFHDPEGRRLRG